MAADFVFVDGWRLRQRVAVVGERPSQPRELGPSCKERDIKHRLHHIHHNPTGFEISCTQTQAATVVDTVHDTNGDVPELHNIPTAPIYLPPEGCVFFPLGSSYLQ